MPKTDNSLSLQEFLSQIGGVIKREMPGGYWVHAEILKVNKGNYCSLELSSDNTNKKEAKARAVVWQDSMRAVDRFESVTGTPLKAGLKILFKCSARFHVQYGLSLDITDIDPAYTLGDMEAKLQAIRSRLTQLNEFHLNRQIPPPKDFCRVAVIAPDNAAGLGDFKSNANKLSDYGLCHFDYFTTKFQGKGIDNPFLQVMLQIIESHNTHKLYDALVIIRGGGDKAGLYELNEIKIARGICRCPIPVFVGVGHERDKTILDEVANQSFETPSFVIGHIEKSIVKNARDASKTFLLIQKLSASLVSDAKRDLSNLLNTSNHYAFQQLTEAKQAITNHRYVIEAAPNNIIRQAKQQVQQVFTTLQFISTKRASQIKERVISYHKPIDAAASKELVKGRQAIENLYYTIQRKPYDIVSSTKSEIVGMRSDMIHNGMREVAETKAHAEKTFITLQTEAKTLTVRANHHVTVLIERVLLQDPKKILARGFALVTTAAGSPLTKVNQLLPNQKINIQLNDGQAQAIVEEIMQAPIKDVSR